MRLNAISYNSDGEMCYPIRHDRAPESALKDYLTQARQLSEIKQAGVPSSAHQDVTALLGERFETLRWFELPQESLDEKKLLSD